MEQTAVNFHLFIGRRNGFKEIIGVLYIYKAVFFLRVASGQDI